jgi:small GTP-binding protein
VKIQVIQKKVCMVGVSAVGKTSLVSRYVYQRFQNRYLSTIGTTISRKEVDLQLPDRLVKVKLIIWDLAGTEHFSTVMQSYFRGVSGVLMVCDLTRPETLSALMYHIRQLREIKASTSFVIVGNKMDLEEERQISNADLEALSESHGVPYFLSSAKTGEQVERVFQSLVHQMVVKE